MIISNFSSIIKVFTISTMSRNQGYDAVVDVDIDEVCGPPGFLKTVANSAA